MKLADNIVYLMNIAGLFSVKRIKILKTKGFWMKEIRFYKQPETFPQTGRIPGAVYFKKGNPKKTIFTFDEKCFDSYRKAKI